VILRLACFVLLSTCIIITLTFSARSFVCFSCSRIDLVQAKGKGMMQTHWLNPAASKKGSSVASSEGEATSAAASFQIIRSPVKDSGKEERLVQWMVKLLMEHLKKIASDHRGALCSRTTI
jgi:hypothetical protein